MPPVADPEAPATRTRTRRRWWRFRFPWVKTAVSAPTDDDQLLIDNTTDREWAIHLGYRELGIVAPETRRLYRVVKQGTLSARRVDAPPGDSYLILHIRPNVHAVQILDISGGERFYELRIADGKGT